MNIICLQDQLKRALAIINRAISARSPFPILSNVLLTAEGDKLTLAASDLEITISQEIPANVATPGTTTLPSRLFTDLVNNLPNDQVALSLNEETQAVNVSCGQFVTNIKGISAEDFPIMPTATSDDHSVNIKASTLRYVIERVAFAASTDESRPVLTGVLVQMKNDEQGDSATAVFSAADGYRLATRSVALESTTIPGGSILEEFIVPARALVELARILADNEFDASITALSNGQILVRAGDTQFVTRLIDGKFPDLSSIIPTEYSLRTTIETSELLKAAKLASIFASASNNFIKVTMVPSGEDTGKCIISANAPEMGDNTSEIDCTIDATDDTEQGKIALNVRFLMDVLKVIDSPRIAIETRTSKHPAAITPVTAHKNYMCLIMPMTLRD